MVYALTITIVAGVLLLLILGGGAVLARRAAGSEVALPAIGRLRWYPSPLGLLLLLPVAALLLWRFFPAFLFIPLIFPFFWRGRRRGTPFFVWRSRRRTSSSNGHKADKSTIEGQYHPLDDE